MTTLKARLLVFILLGASINARAAQIIESFPATFSLDHKEKTVYMEKIRGRYWIDVGLIAEILGATISHKKNVWLFSLPDRTVALNPQKATFSVQLSERGGWRDGEFPQTPFIADKRLMVPLVSLPDLFGKTFTYHLQRKVLSAIELDGSSANATQRIPIKHRDKDKKIWISLNDLSAILGVVVHSAQPKLYNVVLPDFTVLVIRIGEKEVLKRDQPFIRLDNPALLFDGEPYLTVDSVNSVFNVNASWDSRSARLIVPENHGRLREVSINAKHELRFLGYHPQPFAFDLEEFTGYYQKPEPSYPAAHWELYESVRDPLTNNVIDPRGTGMERVSGEGLASLKWNLLGAPLEGKGLFEKIGSTARLGNGTLRWGFPLLRIEGGRDYVTLNGLNNQFNEVDQITLSHSNDHYGDGDRDPFYRASASYGETDFTVFLSTALFSQVVEFDQRYTTGRLELSNASSSHRKFSASIDHYIFDNRVKDVYASYHDADLLRDIFGDDIVITVDDSDSRALLRSTLPERHHTSFLNLAYEQGRAFQFNSVIANSFFKDDATGKTITGLDWLVRSVFSHHGSRLDLSYENVDDDYRSMGNPFNYMSRRIYRAAPFIEFGRPWKLFGEIRREESTVLDNQGIPEYNTDYVSVINLLNFPRNVLRTSVTQFDSSLFGSRKTGGMDYTRYFGRHTVDLGSEISGQWDLNDNLYRQSYTNRMSAQLMSKIVKVSLAYEYTLNHYRLVDVDNFETVTSGLVHIKGFRFLAQYEREPFTFLSTVPLYTGFVRAGHEVGKRKSLNGFYSVSSFEKNLSDSLVWRAGFELLYDF